MELSQKQKELIDRVAKCNGFSDYTLVINPGSFKGDNFLGVLTAVVIKNEKKELEVIIKSAHTNEAFRKAAPLGAAYRREIFLYERVFEEFQTFQVENNISDPFVSVPKNYVCCTEDNNETLVMENLKMEGFQLWNKKIPMNVEHITIVLKEYAKFHAISIAMKQKNSKLFEELTTSVAKNVFEDSDMLDDENKFNSHVKSVMKNAYIAVADDTILKEYVEKLEAGMGELFLNSFKNPDYKLVITHGDCWCNNFLFKYQDPQDTTTPVSIRILDWQLSSLSSPAFDISYFFVVNSSKEILDDYKSFMRIYYDTLSTQLRNFNCDPEKVFPFSTFEDHLRIFMKFGIYMSFTIFKIMICDSDEAPDFSNLSEGSNFLDTMNFKMKNFDAYIERVKDVIKFASRNNFI